MKSRTVRIHCLSVRAEPVEAHCLSSAEEGKERASTSSARTVSRATRSLTQITLTARVSKGTYIRSLARDIAYALESVGHVTMLRRLKAGPFTLDFRDFAGQNGRTR
jgi:tRNA pseudouridine55 synthase